jgi:hypothetical protein
MFAPSEKISIVGLILNGFSQRCILDSGKKSQRGQPHETKRHRGFPRVSTFVSFCNSISKSH